MAYRKLNFISLLACGLASVLPVSAEADTPEAERLFSEGKRQLKRGDYETACTLLEQSFQSDPQAGTLLALAMCHEGQERTATAYREYWEVIKLSREAGRVDRAEAAQARVEALAQAVATLTIHRPEGQSDLPIEVTVDGSPLDSSQLEVLMAMEPGTYSLEASAPGKAPYQGTITLSAHDTQVFTLPPFVDLPTPDSAVAPAAPRFTSEELDKQVKRARWHAVKRQPVTKWGAAQWAGVTTVGLGAIGASVGLRYSFHARNLDHDADRCTDEDDFCSGLRRENRAQAKEDRTSAWVAYGASAGAVGLGLLVFFLADREEVEAGSKVRFSAWGTGADVGGTLVKRF